MRYESEGLPAFFASQKGQRLESESVSRIRGDFFTTSEGQVVRKGDRILRDVGAGAKARQNLDMEEPGLYRHAERVQPEPLQEPYTRPGRTRFESGDPVPHERVRLRAESQPPEGEVYRR